MKKLVFLSLFIFVFSAFATDPRSEYKFYQVDSVIIALHPDYPSLYMSRDGKTFYEMFLSRYNVDDSRKYYTFGDLVVGDSVLIHGSFFSWDSSVVIDGTKADSLDQDYQDLRFIPQICLNEQMTVFQLVKIQSSDYETPASLETLSVRVAEKNHPITDMYLVHGTVVAFVEGDEGVPSLKYNPHTRYLKWRGKKLF